jgi:hypothetical protein
MIYLITNIKFELPAANTNVRLIHHNPWGFSRFSIREEILRKIRSLNLLDSDKIVLVIKPYFYGNRSKIIEQTVLSLHNNVLVLDFADFNLTLLG